MLKQFSIFTLEILLQKDIAFEKSIKCPIEFQMAFLNAPIRKPRTIFFGFLIKWIIQWNELKVLYIPEAHLAMIVRYLYVYENFIFRVVL